MFTNAHTRWMHMNASRNECKWMHIKCSWMRSSWMYTNAERVECTWMAVNVHKCITFECTWIDVHATICTWMHYECTMDGPLNCLTHYECMWMHINAYTHWMHMNAHECSALWMHVNAQKCLWMRSSWMHTNAERVECTWIVLNVCECITFECTWIDVHAAICTWMHCECRWMYHLGCILCVFDGLMFPPQPPDCRSGRAGWVGVKLAWD